MEVNHNSVTVSIISARFIYNPLPFSRFMLNLAGELCAYKQY